MTRYKILQFHLNKNEYFNLKYFFFFLFIFFIKLKYFFYQSFASSFLIIFAYSIVEIFFDNKGAIETPLPHNLQIKRTLSSNLIK